MTTALIIIPLWLLAATALVFLFLKIKHEKNLALPFVPEHEPGIHIETMKEESDVWIIAHPFKEFVAVQLIPNDDALSGTSLPYVERIIRDQGQIEIHFARKVHNFTAIITGAYALAV